MVGALAPPVTAPSVTVTLSYAAPQLYVPQCSAPASYDDFASSINSRIEAVVSADIIDEKKANRSIHWLKKVVQQTKK